MKIGFNLALEQTQKLIMTQELQQAIKILQLSSLELKEYIQQQLETNPLIEEKDNEELYPNGESKEDEKLKDNGEEGELITQLIKNLEYSGGGYSYKQNSEEDYSFENYVSSYTTLKDHLLFQLHITIMSEKRKKIGEYIIESLNGNGYLNTDVAEIAMVFDTVPEEVEKVLNTIHTFDPAGIGCRDLAECLLLQLDAQGIEDPIMRSIIENNLDDLAEKRFNHIAKELDISTGKVQKICDIIKTLEPKPGRAFQSSDDVKYITPDVVVRQIDDEFIVLVNESAAPRLIINSYYKSILNSCHDQPGISKYISGKLEAALWLIRSIEQRRMTLYKVVNAIVEEQEGFFRRGVKSLRPLTLKDIAAKVGVHESTVSRATNGKYVQTPRGTYELKYFFSSGVSSTRGEGVSSESVKEMLKKIIEREDPYKPVSDQRITDALNSKGINISRRTVAKYRDELGIMASGKRKRYS